MTTINKTSIAQANATVSTWSTNECLDLLLFVATTPHSLQGGGMFDLFVSRRLHDDVLHVGRNDRGEKGEIQNRDNKNPHRVCLYNSPVQ